MKTLGPYPEYKPSGVEWLGDIPADWQMKRLRFVAPASDQKLDAKPAGTPYLGLENIESRTGRLLLDVPTETVYSSVVAFRRGDVLFGKLRPYLAKVVRPDFDGVATTELLVLRPVSGVRSDFLCFRLLSPDFIGLVNSFTYGVKMPRASGEQVGNVAVAVPPIEEQRAIADFLDRETARTEGMVAKKERLIDLLQEKRTTLISHAVTKGLNPNAPMKDSGVEWLGQIPAHWEMKRLRNVAEKLQTGPFGSQLHAQDYSAGGIPVINPANIEGGRLVADAACAIDVNTFQRLSRHRLREGDIVFARRGEMGRCGLVTTAEDGWLCGTGSLLLRCDRRSCESRFLNLVLSTTGVRDWLSLESVGSTMENLNTEILSRVPFAMPRLDEQNGITDYIECETAKLDALIAKTQNSIERLQEYRTALISAAVTGKIDVRGQTV
jgi:type I restriction enzyme, S subunit